MLHRIISTVQGILAIDLYASYQMPPVRQEQLIARAWTKTGRSMQKALKQHDRKG